MHRGKEIRVSIWDSDTVRKEVSTRFRHAVESRRHREESWRRNEAAVFSNTGLAASGLGLNANIEEFQNIGLPAVDGSDADMNVAYAFKNLRFIHAQMSANPPAVVMRPNSSDPDDKRKADAADRVCRYGIRHYNMQEKVDQTSLNTLVYGTGIAKELWDVCSGEILEYDEENNTILLEGDIKVSVPSIWNIYLDPDATSTDELKWVIERIYVDYQEAIARWPGKEDLLKASLVTQGGLLGMSGDDESLLASGKYNMVQLLEYWEVGLPTNGYLGRYVVTTLAGEEIEQARPSPHRFVKSGATTRLLKGEELDPEEMERRKRKLPQVAQLPYHILTDIDVPGQVWGKSSLDYAAALQNDLNRLDSAFLECAQAHGVARMVVPATTEITEMGSSNWDVTKYEGAQPPHFMEVPSLMPEMSQLRQNMIMGINDTMGVNEAMFGQQSREQSGASMQYATNQGNMIRRRLFNKYVIFVESLYKTLLKLVAKHWDVQRTIHVIGKEKALEAVDIKGMDIDGGYDVVAEYGVSLSLDPLTRREEIITLQPLFKEAGVSARAQLKLMKLNELEGMYDQLQLAEDRQREVFEEMIATGKYIAPEMWMDHENMIAWALQYFMTVEFKYLEEPLQDLCRKHLVDRAKLPPQEKQILAGNPPVSEGNQLSPGPLPEGGPEGPLPGGPGMTPAAMPAVPPPENP